MIEKTIKIKKEERRKQGEKNNIPKLCPPKVTSGAKYLGMSSMKERSLK